MHKRRRILTSCGVLVVVGIAAAGIVTWRADHQRIATARLLTQGDPERAPPLLRRYGCTGCHTIAGLSDADGLVGPALTHMRERVFIAGRLPNDGETLVKWIQSPQSFSSSAMPDSGISEPEARDVAAYLYTH